MGRERREKRQPVCPEVSFAPHDSYISVCAREGPSSLFPKFYHHKDIQRKKDSQRKARWESHSLVSLHGFVSPSSGYGRSHWQFIVKCGGRKALGNSGGMARGVDKQSSSTHHPSRRTRVLL